MSILPEVVDFQFVHGRRIMKNEVAEDTFHVEQELKRTGLDAQGLPVGSVFVTARWMMMEGANAPAIGDVISFDPALINLKIRRVDQTFVLRVIRVYVHRSKYRFAGEPQAQIEAEGVWLDGTYVIDWVTQTPADELRKRTHNQQDPLVRQRVIAMARKVRNLRDRPGTPGEGAAAAAALQRLLEAAGLTETDL